MRIRGSFLAYAQGFFFSVDSVTSVANLSALSYLRLSAFTRGSFLAYAQGFFFSVNSVLLSPRIYAGRREYQPR